MYILGILTLSPFFFKGKTLLFVKFSFKNCDNFFFFLYNLFYDNDNTKIKNF